MLQSLSMALKSISGNKMRSLLTMLGIIIGVVALVVLVSLVNGATGSVTDAVSSPTFAIVNVYRGGRLTLAHFDMYRVESAEALEDTGYYDLIADGAPVVYAIEWSENIEAALPEDTIFIIIERLGETSRRITIEGGRCQ